MRRTENFRVHHVSKRQLKRELIASYKIVTEKNTIDTIQFFYYSQKLDMTAERTVKNCLCQEIQVAFAKRSSVKRWYVAD